MRLHVSFLLLPCSPLFVSLLLSSQGEAEQQLHHPPPPDQAVSRRGDIVHHRRWDDLQRGRCAKQHRRRGLANPSRSSPGHPRGRAGCMRHRVRGQRRERRDSGGPASGGAAWAGGRRSLGSGAAVPATERDEQRRRERRTGEHGRGTEKKWGVRSIRKSRELYLRK
jgi:hypothetical protein